MDKLFHFQNTVLVFQNLNNLLANKNNSKRVFPFYRNINILQMFLIQREISKLPAFIAFLQDSVILFAFWKHAFQIMKDFWCISWLWNYLLFQAYMNVDTFIYPINFIIHFENFDSFLLFPNFRLQEGCLFSLRVLFT